MKDLAVITAVTKRQGLFNLLEKQLKEAGIDFYVSSQDHEGDMFSFCTAQNKVIIMEDIINSLNEYKYIVYIDGWDNLFFGTKEELIRNIPKNRVLIAAEKVCYPDCSIANAIPDEGTPWMFANFGGVAGTMENFIKFVNEYKSNMHLAHIGMDQEVLNVMLAKGIGSTFELDYNTQMFYCMNEDEGELMNYDHRPLNQKTDQLPNFIHFNGKTDSIHFLKEYGLGSDPIPSVNSKVDFVICLPGHSSSSIQSTKTFECILELMAMGKSVIVRNGSANNIYHVRNLCLQNKGFEMDQVPFEGLVKDYDKIVWIDSDNIVTAKDIIKLSEHNVDIVAGWYSMAPRELSNINPFNNAACGLFGDVNKPWTRRPYLIGMIPFIKKNEMGLIPAHYSGFGLMVIKKGVFEKIGFPWFEAWSQTYQTQNFKKCEVVTDDDAFCQKALKLGFKIWIDPDVRIGHEKLTIQ